MFKFIMPAFSLLLLCTITPDGALAAGGLYFFIILITSLIWYSINEHKNNIFISSLYFREDQLSSQMKEFDKFTDFLITEGFISIAEKYFYKFINQKKNTAIIYEKNKNLLVIEPMIGGGNEYLYYDDNQELKTKLINYFKLLNEMNEYFLNEKGFVFEISRKSMLLHRFWLLSYRTLGYCYISYYLHAINIDPFIKIFLFLSYVVAENVL